MSRKSRPQIQTPQEQQDEYLCRTESGDGVARLCSAALHVERRDLLCLLARYIYSALRQVQ